MGRFNGGWGRDKMYGNNKISDWGGIDDDMFGYEENDAMYGMRGNDRLFGGTGNDTLAGGAGDDDVFGEAGNDIMTYESGIDSFNGGTGIDTVDLKAITFQTVAFDMVSGVTVSNLTRGIDFNVNSGTVREIGGNSLGTLSLTSVEKLQFTMLGDIVVDDGSSRTIETFHGNDRVDAGAGNDIVSLSNGDDVVDGGSGNDHLDGGRGIDEVSFASWNAISAPSTLSPIITMDDPDVANSGSIRQYSSVADMALRGGQLDTFTGFENVTATRFHDRITGNRLDNVIKGEAGNDTIFGGEGVDTIYGGDGNDTISGGAGGDTLYGGAGIDTLDYSTAGSGVGVNMMFLFGSGGEAQNDLAQGFENLTGSNHADTLEGNGAANVISGGNGGDTIRGGSGDDTVNGGGGRDFLSGGMGRDILTGGAGGDDFIYTTIRESLFGTADLVTDFTRGLDRIDVSAIDAIAGTPASDNFTIFRQSVAGGTTGPVIPVNFEAGVLTLSVSEFDADKNGTLDSIRNTVSGRVDAGVSIDFQIEVITSISSGRLDISDFLL